MTLEGCLITIDEKLALTLFKPFLINRSNGKLPTLFPPIDEDELKRHVKCRENYVLKVTTYTADPVANPNDLIVVVIYGEFRDLFYIRLAKDAMWNRVTSVKQIFF